MERKKLEGQQGDREKGGVVVLKTSDLEEHLMPGVGGVLLSAFRSYWELCPQYAT